MENALTMRILGLPAWAWGAILGVGVAGYVYLHNRNSGDANSADTSTVQYDANGDPISSDGMSGPQDSGNADAQYLGTTPLTDYGGGGGFNYSGPPQAIDPTLRLPASVISQLNRLQKEEATVKRQQAILNRQRGHRHPPPPRRRPPRQQPHNALKQQSAR